MTVFSTALKFILQNKCYFLTAGAVLYSIKLYNDYQRLKAFKGPWAAKFTNLWFAKQTLGDSQHAILASVCEKYGAIARIGPNILVTNSPELWMRMSAARSPYTKGLWYAGLQFPPGQDNIFSQINEEKHTKRRAQMADGYAGKTNPTLEPRISQHVQIFVELLRRKYISTDKIFKPIDMGRKASFFTMDIINDVAFGQSFENLVYDRDTFEYIQNTEDMIPTMMKLSVLPLLRTIFQSRFGALFFPSDKSEKGVGKLMGVAKLLASKRFAAKNTDIQQDMLSSFISHGLNENDVMIESVLQIVAGADTTATALRSILLHTMTNPHVYHTLQKEIDKAIRDGRVTGDSVIKDSEAKELPYLQAVIKEGLRIWAPVTGLLSKLSPPEGDTFTLASGEEVHIPGGVNIGVNIPFLYSSSTLPLISALLGLPDKLHLFPKDPALTSVRKRVLTSLEWASWGLQRSKDTFGSDADIFRPERWLDTGETAEDRDRVALMGKLSELIFGYGKYQCLGKNVAALEMNKLIFELFRYFDFQIVSPTEPWNSVNVGLWLQSEMWVRVTERVSSE